MGWEGNIARIASVLAEAAAETLWPTRCALCDAPGAVLCERCQFGLPYVDRWRACPRCGSPYGLVQCDLCNPISLARFGMERFPFDACVSAVHFTGATGQIVRVFKDQGEQRLACDLANIMCRALPPDWGFKAVTFVPATLSALRYRGYDHAELIGKALASLLEVECVSVLDRPRTRDQRKLGAAARMANLAGGFSPKVRELEYDSWLLVDDVFTTGATLCAASQALRNAGARQIDCVSFARV
ncbi:MAG: ComF family protein [Eggerthellaceae bacterium]|nr:ComF family protein [Eggerthellaceae bacterium]